MKPRYGKHSLSSPRVNRMRHGGSDSKHRPIRVNFNRKAAKAQTAQPLQTQQAAAGNLYESFFVKQGIKG